MRSFAGVLLVATVLAAQAPPDKSAWTVKQVTGPPGLPGHKLVLTVSNEKLTLKDGKEGGTLAIPLDQVTQLRYTPTEFNRSQQMLGNKYGQKGIAAPVQPTCPDQNCQRGFWLYLSIWALMATRHGTSHYITVTWVDRGVEQQTCFDVSKRDVDALVTNLRTLTGTRWVNAEDQDMEVAELSEVSASKAQTLDIVRDSWCAHFKLQAGAYQVFAIERGPEVQVYFFAGDTSPEHLTGIAWAKASEEPRGTEIEYAGESGRIVSLSVNGKRLVLLDE